MRLRFIAVAGCVGALAFGVAACGDDDDNGGGGGGASTGSATASGGGETVKIYSSLPLQGASKDQTAAMVQGIELALEEAGGKAGDVTVEYESF